jgi:hypothetical protein
VKGTGKNGVIGESSTLGHASVYGQHTGTSCRPRTYCDRSATLKHEGKDMSQMQSQPNLP